MAKAPVAHPQVGRQPNIESPEPQQQPKATPPAERDAAGNLTYDGAKSVIERGGSVTSGGRHFQTVESLGGPSGWAKDGSGREAEKQKLISRRKLLDAEIAKLEGKPAPAAEDAK